MKKDTKVWLAVAAGLVALGIVLFTSVMFAVGWDFHKLGTVDYRTDSQEIDGDFQSISIRVDTADVELILADRERLRIVCYEDAKVKHTASVQNGVLTVDTVDGRRWYERVSLSFDRPRMAVYLPKNAYESLSVETDTGDITIPKGFSFRTLRIDGDTSDVRCAASASQGMEIRLSTGDIRLEGVAAGRLELTTDTGKISVNTASVDGNIQVETDTGKVDLADVSCRDLSIESDTGSVALSRVVGAGKFAIESDTGNVSFDDCDAAEISVDTDTGDVTGSLLSNKVFLTEASVGRVDVPKTRTGGICKIATSFGDVKITVAD